MTALSKIGIIVRIENSKVKDSLNFLHAQLQKLGADILFHTSCQGILNDNKTRYVDFADFADRDACIVIGGDGTLLHASRALVDLNVPIIGINMGRLGFLVDISPHEASKKISEIFNGHYSTEERFLFRAEVEEDKEIKSCELAANDIVISNYQHQRMIELQTFVDGRYINHERADGLIASTPTGSTAYALSSGGPIVHPALNVLTLVPICPHSLSHRPLVISADSTIEIVLDSNSEFRAQVSFDGQSGQVINPGGCVRITRYEKTVKLIHPQDYDYFGILRAKLNWGKTLTPST